MNNKDLTFSKTEDEIIVDDSYVIDADELIEELENIGDYNGIEEIKEDLDSLDK